MTTFTTKEIWDTAAEFGVSFNDAKIMLEREARYAAGEEDVSEDPRDTEDME